MAKFNEEVFNVEALSRKELSLVGVYLESLLPPEQYEQLKKDWKDQGGVEKIPLWQYALNQIKVSYESPDLTKDTQDFLDEEERGM
jgi:hypothetical protein